MSLFRRKPEVSARAELKRSAFPATAPGARCLHVDYDPALWLRCPGEGEDRTDWVSACAAAWASDLGLAPGDHRIVALTAALDAVADQPLEATATFIGFSPGIERSRTATIDLLDEELMLLENGTPEAFLSFAADPSRPAAVPRTFAGSFRTASRSAYADDDRVVTVKHAHRTVPTEPPLHLAGVGLLNSGADSGPFSLLFHSVKVETLDGRLV